MADKQKTYKASMENLSLVYLRGWYKKEHQELVKSLRVNKTKLGQESAPNKSLEDVINFGIGVTVVKSDGTLKHIPYNDFMNDKLNAEIKK